MTDRDSTNGAKASMLDLEEHQLDAEALERVARLKALLEAHRGERHVVALQDYPDPDAISAAMAYQIIAERYDIRADIFYEGAISHQENLALVRLLDIELIRYSDDIKLSDYNHSVFLDNQGTTTGLTERLEAAGVTPLIIIDHHEPQGVIQAEFTDIRPLSATVTMLVEYLRGGFGRFEPGRPETERLATALMHGLRSETDALIRANNDGERCSPVLESTYALSRARKGWSEFVGGSDGRRWARW